MRVAGLSSTFKGSSSVSRSVGPVSTKSSPCVIETVLTKQILRAEPMLRTPAFDMLLPITLPTAGCVPCAIHTRLQQTNFTSRRSVCPPTGHRTTASLLSFCHECMHVTHRMCMTENVSLWFAAIEIMAFHASNGRVHACRSGRSLLPNSLATIRDMIGMGSLKCFVCVNPLRDDWSDLVLCNGFTFISRKYFNSCSRALCSSCHGNSLLVTSSMHVTCCFFSNLSPKSRVSADCVLRSLL